MVTMLQPRGNGLPSLARPTCVPLFSIWRNLDCVWTKLPAFTKVVKNASARPTYSKRFLNSAPWVLPTGFWGESVMAGNAPSDR
jgi:hypothetical protein